MEIPQPDEGSARRQRNSAGRVVAWGNGKPDPRDHAQISEKRKFVVHPTVFSSKNLVFITY